ncbi:MAG: UDP-N-acetylmuramate--L-alanine ligase [Paludibacter sp.]|jgi:UDP-N-acetylmuramate--alanine ligase|nr:UDP-N-acetylmuramate--L-alanine ligase [Paludibacter sp.]
MNNYSRYYFLGIGGIGMSALARYFSQKGYAVSGYDRTPTPLTADLEKEGIAICYEDEIAAIPDKFLEPHSTFVVYTPAMPPDSVQLNYFRNHNFKILKRSELLGQITRQSKSLCIAGTHGKTTTTTITAHLLYQSAVGCSAFLGGIANNYNSNLLLSKDSNLVVVEADEYDRSFLQLSPYMAVITSLDPDHLDIYGSAEEFRRGFEQFAEKVQAGGTLIIKKDIENLLSFPNLTGLKRYAYSMSDGTADFYAENIVLRNGEIHFDWVAPTARISDLRLQAPIKINVENSVAAIALAWLNGVSEEEIRIGISSYSGIYRRFNTVYKSEKTVYIDDYAHHPNELKASISSIRAIYPDRKITGIFQPHLYTRTRDFAAEFAEALSALDELILLDIYPAREEPIDGVTSGIIFDKVKLENKTWIKDREQRTKNKEQRQELQLSQSSDSKESNSVFSIFNFQISILNSDVLVTFGAGDIDRLVPEIKKTLSNK